MSKHEREIYDQYRSLNSSGWKIQNTNPVLCRSNGGSEKLHHAVAKTVAGKVLEKAGYRVQSEVPTRDGKEADILGFGHEDRKPIVIELEHATNETVEQKKRKNYLKGSVREVWVIDLDNAPTDTSKLYNHIKEITGL